MRNYHDTYDWYKKGETRGTREHYWLFKLYKDVVLYEKLIQLYTVKHIDHKRVRYYSKCLQHTYEELEKQKEVTNDIDRTRQA